MSQNSTRSEVSHWETAYPLENSLPSADRERNYGQLGSTKFIFVKLHYMMLQ